MPILHSARIQMSHEALARKKDLHQRCLGEREKQNHLILSPIKMVSDNPKQS